MPRARSALWIGGLALGLGLLGTGARVLSTKRIYRSEATIVYEPGVLQGEPDSPQQIGQRLREMLTARPRLQKLIEEMRLYPTVVGRRGLVEAVDGMRADVQVSVRPGTSFGVSYDADDRDRARAVLTRLVSGVVDDDTRRRQREAETTRQTLDTERRQAEQDLKTQKARLAAFSAAHPQLVAKSAVSASDRERSTDVAAEVASLELRSAELEATLAPSSGHSQSAHPAVAGAAGTADPAVVAARAKVAANLLVVERDLDDKQTRLPYQHPDVMVALRRVADARAALRKADAAVAASAAAPVTAKAVSVEKIASLQRALAAVRSRIAALQAQSDLNRPDAKTARSDAAPDTTGARLARDVSEARERRRQLEAKLFQAQLLSTLGAAGQGGRLVVSEPSYQPSRPIAGHRLKAGLSGAAMSALLALLALMVAGRLDERLYDPGDIARILGPNVVVVVPKLGVKLVGRQPARVTNTGV